MSQNSGKVIDKMEFSIKNVSEEKLELKLVSVADEYFEIELPQSVKPGEVVKGKLKLVKTTMDQSFEKSFTIEASDKNASRFTVPVKRNLNQAPNAQASSSDHH